MAATAAPDRPQAARDDYEARRLALRRTLRIGGLSKADVARGIGYDTESGAVYVRSVLNGGDTSAPVLTRAAAFAREELQRRAAAGDRAAMDALDMAEDASNAALPP